MSDQRRKDAQAEKAMASCAAKLLKLAGGRPPIHWQLRMAELLNMQRLGDWYRSVSPTPPAKPRGRPKAFSAEWKAALVEDIQSARAELTVELGRLVTAKEAIEYRLRSLRKPVVGRRAKTQSAKIQKQLSGALPKHLRRPKRKSEKPR